MGNTKNIIVKNIFKNINKAIRNKKNNNTTDWQHQIADSVRNHTMTSRENVLTLIKVIKEINENNIEGDIVECGVWKGGSMMAAAKTLNYLKDYSRQIYLFDTFSTFSDPEEVDITHHGKTGADILIEESDDGICWKAPTEEMVRQNMKETEYPFEKISFIKGKVEETIPKTLPNKISLLRLDTDWYTSTKHELEWLYPKLEKGGALIIDDYGYWQGCKKAVDEYFSKSNTLSRLIKIDFSARLLYKE